MLYVDTITDFFFASPAGAVTKTNAARAATLGRAVGDMEWDDDALAYVAAALTAPKRTLHYYTTDRVTHQMTCVGCGKNIIDTPRGDTIADVHADDTTPGLGFRQPKTNEVVCVGDEVEK